MKRLDSRFRGNDEKESFSRPTAPAFLHRSRRTGPDFSTALLCRVLTAGRLTALRHAAESIAQTSVARSSEAARGPRQLGYRRWIETATALPLRVATQSSSVPINNTSVAIRDGGSIGSGGYAFKQRGTLLTLLGEGKRRL
jgi:hypothetical protein